MSQRPSLSMTLRHYVMALPNWLAHNVHNSWGILNVFDLVWLRPMPGGLLPIDHPLATGISADTGELIWDRNCVFATAPLEGASEDDRDILHRVMTFISSMVQRSSASSVSEVGIPSRMPPAINFIHGSVHYNGASMLFNDIPEAVRHFSDPDFKREIWRLLLTEGRDLTIIFRCVEYDRDELALFSCFMKTIFPFFGNPNGPKKRIHWGTPSPYPVYNLIAGYWIRDTRKLLTAEGRASVARPPIPAHTYFLDKKYDGGWSEFRLPEKLLDRFTSWRIHIRGAQGGVYFVDAIKLKSGFRFDPSTLPTLRDRLREKLHRPARS